MLLNTVEAQELTDGIDLVNTYCVHHWMIDTPDGSTWLDGRCKKCGAEKQFRSTPQAAKYQVQKFIIVEESIEELAEKEAKEAKKEEEW